MKLSNKNRVRSLGKLGHIHALINNLLWYGISLATLTSVNLHVTNVLMAIQAEAVDTTHRLSIGISNIIALLLTGWLFFSVFLQPGSQGVLPNKDIRSDTPKTQDLLLRFIYIEVCRSFVLQTGLLIAHSQTYISSYYYIGCGIIGFAWSITKFVWWRRTQHPIEPDELLTDLLDISSLDIEIQAKAKFKKLAREEQHELAEMVYKNDMVKKATVQTLAKILWGSLLVAFLLDILEEIIGQLISH